MLPCIQDDLFFIVYLFICLLFYNSYGKSCYAGYSTWLNYIHRYSNIKCSNYELNTTIRRLLFDLHGRIIYSHTHNTMLNMCVKTRWEKQETVTEAFSYSTYVASLRSCEELYLFPLNDMSCTVLK